MPVFVILNYLLLLDGQPPKYNTKNQKAMNESTFVQSHPEIAAKNISPPTRKSSTLISESTDMVKANSNINTKDSMVLNSGESAGILYCEDYAEIVENEEGDYSR